MTHTLRNEIAACLAAFAPDGENAAQTAWIFPRGFTGFQGHFPNHPVCPGVCVVAAQLEAAGRLVGAALELVEIENAKFMWPVFPEKKVDGRVNVLPVGKNCWRVNAELKRGERRIAKLQLLARIEGGVP
jgi:3-hydroxyacyl-[acyl-carrier-protein] dehydratase